MITSRAIQTSSCHLDDAMKVCFGGQSPSVNLSPDVKLMSSGGVGDSHYLHLERLDQIDEG